MEETHPVCIMWRNKRSASPETHMRMERTAACLKAEPPPMRLLLLATMALTGSEAG